MNRETHTASDAERALRAMQRDPAAVGYGAHLRRKGIIGMPAATPLPVSTPGAETADAERDLRRAMAQRFRL
ncbi:hypothetical protein [Methylobacterium symbioticum]|uniref:Uncharacterized protein n=1 Tax=Methylobacterium symbioticum TaxID=2584084 RepID=A0A509EEI3_9HYPH|nr:hypothetical protein [Methylobacterium symbioticum]VUD71849.1 hypothetical protein MET9862_02438 [Methylobacterium symbioticum]